MEAGAGELAQCGVWGYKEGQVRRWLCNDAGPGHRGLGALRLFWEGGSNVTCQWLETWEGSARHCYPVAKLLGLTCRWISYLDRYV